MCGLWPIFLSLFVFLGPFLIFWNLKKEGNIVQIEGDAAAPEKSREADELLSEADELFSRGGGEFRRLVGLNGRIKSLSM